MSSLGTLGKALQAELGAPPVEWREQQRCRLRAEPLQPRPRPHLRWAAVAALTCALVFIGTLASMGRGSSPRTGEEISTVWLEGTSSSVSYRAADGSSVRLEEGSRGRFSSDEDGAQFDLHGGRATFEVVKRPGRNWTVVAGRYSLRVIGTRFSVSYHDGALSVWVDDGRVAVSVPQRADRFLLEAGDQLQTDGEKLTLEARRDDFSDGATRIIDDVPPRGVLGDGDGADPVASEVPHGHSGAPDPARHTTSGTVGVGSRPSWHALYSRGHYAEALREANRVGFGLLTRKLGASKLVDLADAARLGGDSDAALEGLRALELRFAAVAAARDSDFLVARLHAQRGETSSAIRRLTAYLKRGEGARYEQEALGRLVELHSRRGDTDQARSLARRYVERAPNGPYRRLAESVLRQTR